MLTALMNGSQIKFEGHTYVISEDNHLCVLGWREEKGVKEELLLPVDFSFKQISDMANKIGFDQLFIAGCEGALMRANRDKWTK